MMLVLLLADAAAFSFLTALIADAVTDTNAFGWISPLLQFGGVGVCLAWFMMRSEPRLRAIEAAIDRITRALIVLSISIASALEALHWYAAKAIRVQAEPIEKELDEAAKLRDTTPK
jgi:hypothetical protein